MNRPSWDIYFMAMAFLAAQRSPDSETKHGSCLVDKNKKIIAFGFNGFPRGCKDENLPTTRAENKYPFLVHSEVNAIINANKIDLEGSKLYVTGPVCHECLKIILQYKIGEVIYGNVRSNCIDTSEKHTDIFNRLIEGQSIKLMPLESIIPTAKEDILSLLGKTLEYVKDRF